MRPAFAALCAACALSIGFAAFVVRTAISADVEAQASQPLSKVPPVERFGQAALDAQSDFLQRMPDAEIRYGDNGAVSWIKGRTGIVLKSGLLGFKVNQPARELLAEVGPALLAAGTEELRVISVATEAAKADAEERAKSPERTIRTVQYIRGLEVQTAAVNIVLNRETNEIVLLVADFLPDRGLPHGPKLTAAEARAKVEAAMRDAGLEEEQKFIFTDAPARLAYAFEDIGNKGGIGGALVWVFQASSGDMPLEVNVNALTGEVVRWRSLIIGFTKNRNSYDAHNGVSLSGATFTFGEGGIPPDQEASDAYINAGTVFDVFDQAFGRNSWDGAGAPIRLVTHWGTGVGNAFYTSGGWLIFNDGDVNTKSTAEDLDAVAHEYTHGIFEERTHILPGTNTPVDGAPALHEGFADVGAAMVDAHLHTNTPSASTWQIAALNRNNPLDGIRNLRTPTLEDPFARDWYPTRTFMIGTPTITGQSIYRNSAILGQAFYLLAQTGVNRHYRAGLPLSEVPVIDVTGLGYETARNIFYYSLNTGVLLSNTTYFGMRDATLAASIPSQETSVSQAWAAVGVGYNCTSAPQAPWIQVWPGYCLGRNKITWNAVPGATTYDGQATPVLLGWAFGQTITDGNVLECKQNIPRNTGDWWVRVRACNGCGCSGWSPQGLMEYWETCQ